MNLNKAWLRSGILTAIVLLAMFILNAGKETEQTSSPSFRVTKAKLIANPATYMGPCPKEINFKVKITVTGGPGTVVCQIVRSDNLPAPSFTMPFERAGTKDTTYSWRLDDSFLGWQQLVVVKPNPVKSNKVEFSVMCQ